MCSRARQAEGSANSRISPRNQPLMKQINWAAKWRDHIAQLKCKKKQPFLPFWGSLEENLGRDCHLDDLIKPRRSPKGHEIKLFLCWRPHLNVTSATQLGSWGNFQHQYTLQNVPGEELTLTPANLERFAYQGKDLVWGFFLFFLLFSELWLFFLSHSSLAANPNLIKNLVLRDLFIFPSIAEMLPKQRGASVFFSKPGDSGGRQHSTTQCCVWNPQLAYRSSCNGAVCCLYLA